MCTRQRPNYLWLIPLLLLPSGCKPPDGADLPPDNTAINERDLDPGYPTPEQQGNSEADLELTARIRSRVNDIEDFSTYAKNVKIMSLNGHVTLRGPVASDHERDVIANIAQEIAGQNRVHNQLEVARK